MRCIARPICWLTAACLLAIAVGAVVGQVPTLPAAADPPPLLQLLALVPNMPAAQAGMPFLRYVDYRAVVETSAGGPTFESRDAVGAADAAGDAAAQAWLRTQLTLEPTPAFFARVLEAGPALEESAGFDLFDVDRALVFGQPPAQGMILQGAFDVAAVQAAFFAGGYTAEDNNGVVILRARGAGPEATADASAPVLAADPFSGDSGEPQPVAVTGEHLLHSADDDLLDDMVFTYVGYEQALFTQPALAAAAETLSTRDGRLLQAAFLRPATTAEWRGSDLPPYELAAIADLRDENEQVALVAVVYDSRGEARAASRALTARLTDFPHCTSHRAAALVGRVDGVYVGEPGVVFSRGAERYVALASVRVPALAGLTAEPALDATADAGPDDRLPGNVFHLWLDCLYRQQFDVLDATEGEDE